VTEPTSMTPTEILAARKTLRVSQTVLAKRLGVGRQTLWRWETGNGRPEQPTLLRLALRYLIESQPPHPVGRPRKIRGVIR
jgi:DNA-binding transcriptional regulator YiaG